VTLLNSAGVGFYADLGSSSSEVGDGSYTINGKNMLVVGSSQSGFRITSAIQTWSLDSADSYNNGTNYNSPSSGQCTNCTNYQTTDPQLGLCKVWIPTGSPMKRTGQNGMDIGANILYRYQNGILTTQPLWDPVAGRFPCGAIMAGVNDISGASCSNVHQRLNVNTNGCSFPPSYRQQSGTVAPPQNFRISGVQ
jgi:hypothetical protein